MKRFGLLAAMVLFPCILEAQAKAPAAPATPNSATENALHAVDRLVKIQRGWGPAASTPGMSLALVETGRANGTITYRMKVSGVPAGEKLTLVSWPIDAQEPVPQADGVTVNGEGVAICAGAPGTCKGPAPNDPIDLKFHPVSGEPQRVGLISPDHKVQVFAKVTPIPLRVVQNGCTLDATMLAPAGQVVLLDASGFASGTDFAFSSNSEGDIVKGAKKTTKDGTFSTALAPFKKGLSKGTVTVELKSSACAPVIKIPWGPAQ